MIDSIMIFEKEHKAMTPEEKSLMTEKIHALEASLVALAESTDASGYETKHHFSEGVYAREIKVPADNIIVGKIHKHTNLNILSQGEILIASIDGVQKFTAPATIVSSPGVKRVGYALTDCVWTTIHGTHETDLEKIEDEFIAKSYDEVKGLPVTELKITGG
jgi:hypothetical protein